MTWLEAVLILNCASSGEVPGSQFFRFKNPPFLRELVIGCRMAVPTVTGSEIMRGRIESRRIN